MSLPSFASSLPLLPLFHLLVVRGVVIVIIFILFFASL
jgi:hypothetical protein